MKAGAGRAAPASAGRLGSVFCDPGRASPSQVRIPANRHRPEKPSQRGRASGARLPLERTGHRLLARLQRLSCGLSGSLWGGSCARELWAQVPGRAHRMPTAQGWAREGFGVPPRTTGLTTGRPSTAHLQVTREWPSPEGRLEAGAGRPGVLGSRAGRRGSQGREGSGFRGSTRPVASELPSLLCDAGGRSPRRRPSVPQRVPSGLGVGEGEQVPGPRAPCPVGALPRASGPDPSAQRGGSQTLPGCHPVAPFPSVSSEGSGGPAQRKGRWGPDHDWSGQGCQGSDPPLPLGT